MRHQNPPFSTSKEISGEFQLVSLDNATIESDFLSTCLVVGYSWYGGSSAAEEEQLLANIMLVLSLDNASWIQVQRHNFDNYDNISGLFRICNMLLRPFPFDIEPGETLYVSIQYCCGMGWPGAPEHYNCWTTIIGIMVTSGIIRPWYFTIDWTLPGIFGAIFVCVFAVFLISRHSRQRRQMEGVKTLRK